MENVERKINFNDYFTGIRKFYSKKKFFKIFGGEIRIYDENKEKLLCFVKQKAFKLKEDILVYADETMQQVILRIKAESILDLATTYSIYKYNNQIEIKIGALKREFLKSLIRDSWKILDEYNNEVGYIQEDSMFKAMLRRYLINLIPQTFEIYYKDKLSGILKQTFNPFIAQFKADFSINPEFPLELGIASLILLQFIEGRQSEN
ncbi:MAG: hypothetical protein KatS3mg129_0407 [Leptospiraceae bacterium]|nr:MAG: hypothetical protein KatS3mg129_0407 [Leptospiraceae bacterium]